MQFYLKGLSKVINYVQVKFITDGVQIWSGTSVYQRLTSSLKWERRLSDWKEECLGKYVLCNRRAIQWL